MNHTSKQLLSVLLILCMIISITTFSAPAIATNTQPIISAGGSHSLALKGDGSVWAWGLNGDGQLGDGTIVTRVTPVAVSGLSDITAISAGGSHSLALKKDGTVWTWGSNSYGQLGDDTKSNRNAPVKTHNLNLQVTKDPEDNDAAKDPEDNDDVGVGDDLVEPTVTPTVTGGELDSKEGSVFMFVVVVGFVVLILLAVLVVFLYMKGKLFKKSQTVLPSDTSIVT